MNSRIPVLLILLAVAAPGCQSTIEKLSCATDAVEASDGQPSDKPAEGVETGGDTGPTLKPTGAPCTADAECEAGQCLTTEFVKNLNPAFDVPGGMCSKFMCAGDAECGAGAVCFDGTSLTGGTPIMVCLHLCADYFDCRYAAGYECFADPGGSGKKACLPESIVMGIRCGDKVCDENEKAQGSCPEDCT